MRRSDAYQIFFYLGASLICLLLSLFFIIIPSSDPAQGEEELDSITNTLYILRMALFMTYIVAATGFCIDVFTRYSINYLYIFELDPHAKMTHFTLYRITTLFLLV